MQYPKTLSALSILLVLLLVAAASPATTAELVAYPSKRVMEWKREAKLKERQVRREERWAAVRAAAERGDADSLANVGFSLLYGGNDRMYPAVEPDSVRGWQMLQQASGGGSIPAAFWLWAKGKAGIERLRELDGSSQAAKHADSFQYAYMMESMRSCDLELLRASAEHGRRVPDRIKHLGPRDIEIQRVTGISGWMAKCGDAADSDSLAVLRQEVRSLQDSLRADAMRGDEMAYHGLYYIDLWACDAEAVERLPSLLESMPVDDAAKARLRTLKPVTGWPEHCPRPQAG